MSLIAENTNPIRQHLMPFGVQIMPDGKLSFRFWAPGANQVHLCVRDQDADIVYPMQAEAEGWFVLTVNASIGSQYRYRIEQQYEVPDPASRFQPNDVHGYSQVINPGNWHWTDNHWQGRSWHEAVIYELHVGSFTPEGSFIAIIDKLDYLLALGVTAIQLMPIADFPGQRNWGYDGVLPFAPDSRYGTPDDLKLLVQTAHSKGLMVFLDVVYNHFGPEGNYLHLYAGAFFHKRQRTPWGKAFNFDGKHSHWVRQFFIHNALYWLEEFHFDGLRLDAVQAIFDSGQPHFLAELADTVKRQLGKQRQIHLMLENDANNAAYLEPDTDGTPKQYAAQWNDDFHHALHVLLTGESWGYYQDYADQPLQHLSRCLTAGFAYQGETSSYRNGKPRGEASGHLTPLAFINFLQNHDQIGNRAFAERINQLAPIQGVRAATALLLLAPFPPMLFMGQEWGSRQPFAFFCDFETSLAKRVAQARRREFADMPGFEDAKSRKQIPDPAGISIFEQSMLSWQALNDQESQVWLKFHRHLLVLRQQEIMPRLPGMRLSDTTVLQIGAHGLRVDWQMGDGSLLILLANLSAEELDISHCKPTGRLIYASFDAMSASQNDGLMPAWSIVWAIRQ